MVRFHISGVLRVQYIESAILTAVVILYVYEYSCRREVRDQDLEGMAVGRDRSGTLLETMLTAE